MFPTALLFLRSCSLGPQIEPSKAKIRLMIASTLSISALTLAHSIGSEEDLHVVGTISPETRSSDACKDDPDILLVDVDKQRRELLRVIEEMQKRCSGVRPIAILHRADDATVRMFLRVGVRGLVMKAGNSTALFDAIRTVHHGHRYLDTGLSDVVMNVIQSGAVSGRNVELTNREQQVLNLIAGGRTYKEIASALTVSVKTVETYRTRIGEKLQLRKRKALVEFAIANGLTN